jgi:SAM-dependent methyltransferase
MVTWEYQDINVKRNQKYPDDLPNDFYQYNGPNEITKWFNWISHQKKPDYFRKAELSPLIELSKKYDYKLLDKFSLEFEKRKYEEFIGRYNAQDYLFQNGYRTPERYKINKILDFGAGYGRQSNIWTQKRKDIIFVGMDAIPLPYCLQHLYYSHLDFPYYEYVIKPSNFRIDKKSGIYHLPTWRCDLLPKSFFDMVICVQVLQELNIKLLKYVIDIIHNVLKPGGCLYIRDDDNWKPTHRLNLNKYLPKKGFVLEYKPHLKHNIDIHGVPRIWRKIDPKVINSQYRN